MTNDNTPTIRWNQPTVPREPLAPILEHALWILRCWRPDEFDLYGNEAYWALEQLGTLLIDRDADAHSYRDVLSQALEMLQIQDQRLDRQYELIASLRNRLRNQPKAAA